MRTIARRSGAHRRSHRTGIVCGGAALGLLTATAGACSTATGPSYSGGAFVASSSSGSGSPSAAGSSSGSSSSGAVSAGSSSSSSSSGSSGGGIGPASSGSGSSGASSGIATGGSGSGGPTSGGSGSGPAGADAGPLVDASGSGGGPPGVRIVGRTATDAAGNTRFAWSGVSIAARFTGTQVSIQLDDASNRNEFTVMVDGTMRPNLVTTPGTTTYVLATGLASGTHDLLVWKRTEASDGPTVFTGLTGFSAGGALLAPPAAPAHRIEIIGDSISCGYGNEGNASCTNSQLESIENNYLAYGTIAARDLNADVFTIAWSGIGIYRNYNDVGPSTGTMPQRYDFTIPTDTNPATWDFTQYQPQAVVINLTSNDFSTHGDPGQPYINDFVSFVRHVRSNYPGAYIFLLVEWQDNGTDSAPDVNTVVSTIQAGGDMNIESFNIHPYADSNGCQGHPDLSGDKSMGDALAAEIQRVLRW